VPDLPFLPSDPSQLERIAAAFDPEAKVLRSIETLAPVEGRRVALLGTAPLLAARLAERGATVTTVEPSVAVAAATTFTATGLADHSVDVAIATWTGFDGAADAAELAEALRILVPGSGRLLLLKDYGRDDLTDARGPERTAHLLARSRRDGWLLTSGFRLHVIHAWWRFADVAQGTEILNAALGGAAEPVIARLWQPRLAHNVSVFHLTAAES